MSFEDTGLTDIPVDEMLYHLHDKMRDRFGAARRALSPEEVEAVTTADLMPIEVRNETLEWLRAHSDAGAAFMAIIDEMRTEAKAKYAPQDELPPLAPSDF